MNEPEELMARIVDLEAQLKVSEMAPPAAEQLIACLEGEIAKRDARIVELESAAESLRLSRDYHHEQEIEYRRRWAGIYAAPVPAGVGGLEVVAWWLKSSKNGEDLIGFGSSEHIYAGVYDDKIPLCDAPKAQAIIDGLRGESEALHDQVKALQSDANSWQSGYDEGRRMGGKHCALTIDQHAQRIGELEGLLLRVQVSLSLNDTEWGYSGAEKYKLLAGIRAAMSAGKEGEL